MGYLKFRDDIIAIVIFLVLPVIYLSSALFSGSEVLGSQFTDLRSEFFYTRFFGFNIVSSFSVPLWNPHIFGGMPFIATLHPAIFYPLNLIFTAFSIVHAINWSIALHLFLSGVFTYYLLKYFEVGRFGAIIGGIVYTFSAPQVMHIYAGHLNALTAMVWTPLMFLFLGRLVRDGFKYGIPLGITISMQMLAGQPQYLFYSLLSLSFYSLFLMVWLKVDGTGWSKIFLKCFSFAFAIFLGLLLSAVQILPTAEMTRDSTRENLSYEFVSLFSFPPESLITFLIPDFFGDMLRLPYWGKNYLWEMSAYVGIMPLILAVIAAFYVRKRIVWFFAALAVISVILALGKYTPLLNLLYSYVPGFNLFRGNSKFIFLNALSLAVLSGFGADVLIKCGSCPDKRLRAGIIGFSIFLTLALLSLYVVLDEAWFREAVIGVINSGDMFNNPATFMQRGFETVAAATFNKGVLWTIGLSVSGVAILLLYSYGKLKREVFMTALLGVIVFDLFTFGMRYMVTFDSKEVYWDKDIVSFLRQDREPFRVIAPEMNVNSGMATGIETLGGYDTIMLKRYSEFINFSQGQSPDVSNLWLSIKSVNKLTDLLNAKYLVLDSGQEMSDPVFKAVFDNGLYRIYQNLNALPRAFVVHRAEVIRDRDAIFRELISPEFDTNTSAVVEEELNIQLSKPLSKSPLPRVINHSPNKVTIEAYLAQPGLLVLGDTYYPGWKAFVDGKESKIYPVNYVMRGVVLPEGGHIVEFRYDPLSFKVGAVITLLSLVLVTGFFVWDLRKKKNG